MHPLSLTQAHNQICDILTALKNKPLSQKAYWRKPLFGSVDLKHLKHGPWETLSVPVLFALETLLLAFYRRQFLKDFGLKAGFSAPVNKLWLSNSLKPPASKTIKIKAAGCAHLLTSLQKILDQNPCVKLRLDLNKTGSVQQIKNIVQFIPKQNLDYIEDPYPRLKEGLKQFSAFPLGIDKDLAGWLQTAQPFPKNTKALVIKPSRDLSLHGALNQIQKHKALKSKIKITISSAYETPIGLWPLAHLAAAAQNPAGLDVQKIFVLSPKIIFHPLTANHIVINKSYQNTLTHYYFERPLKR